MIWSIRIKYIIIAVFYLYLLYSNCSRSENVHVLEDKAISVGKLAITKAKTVVTVNTYSRVCSRACNSPTKYSLKVVVHAALGPREAMWCGGGDEMWGVSGQGSLEDEWGWRGQTEQLEHLFSFWFPIGLSFILIVTDLFGNEGSIRKLDFYFFYNTGNIILHREEESYILYIFRPIDSAGKSWQAQIMWLVIHYSMMATYLHF